MPAIVRRLAPLAAGLLLALTIPPWGFWVLAPAGVALFAWGIEDRTRRGRMLGGLLLGLGQFIPALFWMAEFQAVGYLAVVLLESAFLVAACALLPAASGRLAVALPGALVLAEWARGEWPFGGLPMGGVPLGQATGWLAPAARVGGGLLLVAVAAALGVALRSLAARAWRPAAVAAVAAVGLVVLGAVSPDGAAVGSLRTALVQGGGPRGFRAVDTDPSVVLDRHLAASERLEPPLDLVLWPENVIDVDLAFAGSEVERATGAIADRVDATLVAGVTEDVPGDRFQNVAVAWAPDGQLVDRYVKVNRVPFGEYVPGRALFSRLADLSVIPRDAVAGRGPGVLDTPAGPLGVAISYEVFFSERGRSAARHGGQVLLIPTNAASFSTSQVPAQEVAASQLQAWSTGRWVVQAAPTGFSAFVAPNGRVSHRTDLGARQVEARTIELRRGETVYVRFGDLPVLLLAAGLVAAGWVRRPSR